MQHSTVQGHLEMSLVVSPELSFGIGADLVYEAGDPYAVRFAFNLPGDTPVTWVFARELLRDGLSRPSGEGDVHIHPLGGEPPEVRIALHTPHGDAVLHAPAAPLVAFLARTDRLVPTGQEFAGRELDAQLAAILRGCDAG
ncbi:SsgA family sporulation/cell division regulator [Kitasatospora sp. NPDC101157]|uniref:SsgA family sporulation/cell division regulator n=1 Tax=Kitasatospora sp. NPDC101157 TaxID=3364098 RepID=UPI00381D6858